MSFTDGKESVTPIASSGLRFVYYRIYQKYGAIATKRPAYSNDACLGRIKSNWVTPPHTACSLRLCLSSLENIDPSKTMLFSSLSGETALEDETSISLKSGQSLGIIPEVPVVLFTEAMPEAEMKPGTQCFCVPPDVKSPLVRRFLYYGVYSEAGASVSKDPIDPEEAWISKVDLNLIPPPASFTSLWRLLTMKEDIITWFPLFTQDGLTPLGDTQVLMDDGNWLGATAEDHVLLKFASRPQLPTFKLGYQYKIQNCFTGNLIVLWTNYRLGIIQAASQHYHEYRSFTLKICIDGGVAFRSVREGKWATHGCPGDTEHSFRCTTSVTNRDSFFICENDISLKAFYDPGPSYADGYYGYLEWKDLNPTETRQMWRLIAV